MDFVVGILVGALLYWLFVDVKKRQKPSGTFFIDVANPEEETFRLEWDDSISEIYSKKYVILNVKVLEDHSQN